MKRGQLRNWMEFALARSVLAAASVLPTQWMPRLAAMLGWTLDAILKGRRRVVEANVRLAYGDDPAAPNARALSRASFTNLCLSFLDLVHVPRRADALRERVQWSTPEEAARVQELLAKGPVIFATSHFGAYEVMGMWSHLGDIPLCALVRPLDNPLLERFLRGQRTRFGQVIAGNRGGARVMTRHIEEGGSVGILADLNMRGPKRVFVDYFGVPAATATTIARLARRYEAPVLPVFCHRTEDPRRFRLELGRVVEPDPEATPECDDQRILESVTEDIEVAVRARPDHWMWTHRRWKTRPEEQSKA